jgi:hypothetical protein
MVVMDAKIASDVKRERSLITSKVVSFFAKSVFNFIESFFAKSADRTQLGFGHLGKLLD